MSVVKIKKHINTGKFFEAISMCDLLIKTLPNFYVYHELKALALYNLTDYERCLDALVCGQQVKTDSIVMENLRKKCLLKLGAINKLFCGKELFLNDNEEQRKLEGGNRLRRKKRIEKLNSGPLVSIVTVVFNNTVTFERCIRSVIEQTYDNVEYIIIDGGSEQPTIDIINKYSEEIEYFVSEPDKGIYDAMNKGITVAQGDFVCLLNSDDCYEVGFVEKSINKLIETGADVSYTNYMAGKNSLVAEDINVGVLLGHLNICHNTFLVSRDTYDEVGPYREDLRIISDAVWIRKAFKNGVKFAHINESLFTLTDGGLSSGGSEEHRRLFINEVSKSYVIQFPFLTMEDAEELYLFRFNNKRLSKVLAISAKYNKQTEFNNALRLYVQYCFQSRDNFKLSHTESNNLFLTYLKAVEVLGVELGAIRINTKHGCLSEVLDNLNNIIKNRKLNGQKTILHFVSVFSAPSETFIYDLLNRLQSTTDHDNFVLYEHEKLPLERPFKNKLFVPWADFRPEVASQIYKFIFEKLSPDIVIAHFALNEWKLNKRISPLGIDIPTLTMTHGIDVFSMKSDVEYKEYILNDFSKRKNTHFTAVSDYLYNELASQGVPQEKITRVYNTANPEFFKHRKTKGFYDYNRELRLLSVGRCIDLKGYTDLIFGIGQFVNNVCANTTLTIVYGNGVDNLNEVKSCIVKNKLEDKVKLVPFVNFLKERDYLSNFDVYIQASKYSSDNLKRSETFGVAALEAVLAGLPIIVTDAGGLPEVAGNNGRYSQIVKHKSGIQLSKALERFYNAKETFTDNISYAEERFNHFSEEKQINALNREIKLLTDKPLKVAMFSTSTIQGAGYAAFRLFKGLRDITSKIEPTLYTTVRNHEGEASVNVVPHPGGHGKGWQILQSPENSKPGMTIFTKNHPAISNSQLSRWVKDCDVINIHWTARFLSLENIAFLTQIGKPVVMTIRDMQPITGGCHFFHGCDKWKTDCSSCPQLYDTYDDFPAKVLAAKRELYNFDNLTLVALSNHTKNILKQVPYFKDCRIEVIPNSIETDVFKPTDKLDARKALGLPENRKIIGYVPSFASEVKGYKEIIQAFKIINEKVDDGDKPMVMLVGNKTPADEEILLDKMSLGYIADDEKLALAYSAADVIVVPSLEETFSNTTAESIACGTPVVGFKTGAIPDLAKGGVTGLSYEIGDVSGLVTGIFEFLGKEKNVIECKKFADKQLEFSLQAYRYQNLYSSLVASSSNHPITENKDEYYWAIIDMFNKKIIAS
jgi:glycosyltransferase involved in cell wall biosynthesis